MPTLSATIYRTALVTGASSGIGQALAARFHRAGYRLALVARRVAEVQAWAQSQGFAADTWAVYAADVRDVDAITGAGRACIAAQGLPNVVIAAAGISVGIDTAIFDDLEVMRAIYETNNLGTAATFQPFVTPMRERRSGTLVGIASVSGIRGLPGHGAYCASKAAVISHCETLRVASLPPAVMYAIGSTLPGVSRLYRSTIASRTRTGSTLSIRPTRRPFLVNAGTHRGSRVSI